MPKITTFLTFANQAEEAATLYTSIFKNSTITQTRRLPSGTVLSVSFVLDGREFIAMNGGPSFTFASGISLFVHCDTQEEVDAYWEKLTEGGEPGQCGWLKDKFGVSWQIVPEALGRLLASKDPEKGRRVMQAMLQMTKIDTRVLEEA
ncbi:VOC family protein [Spirosoma aerophilum]